MFITCTCGKCKYKKATTKEMIAYFKKTGDKEIVKLLKDRLTTSNEIK